MSEQSRYWQFNRLNLQGKVIVEEIAEAKNFIQKECSELFEQITFSDAVLQCHLFILWQKGDRVAEICLRCFISEQIQQVCLKLEYQFGDSYQFKCSDLLPFVLDDSIERFQPPKNRAYTSKATKILHTFNPDRASLSTWITRLVRYEPNLNKFLLECGLYLISDWAILNDTDSKQIRRILKDYHNFNDATIDDAVSLLEAYHRIYRQARLVGRKGGSRSKCEDPTTQQLQQISSLLGLSLSPEYMLAQLQNIAEKLREYRILKRGGKIGQISLDNPDLQNIVEQKQIEEFSDSSDLEVKGEFLTSYRQQFLNCLKVAIASVVTQWGEKQKEPKKQQFLDALKLFHCQGLSMTEIAKEIGLQAQYQVTRLMQLKNLRSDIRQKMLQELRQQIRALANVYLDVDRLIQQEEQIEIALSEQIDAVIAETEKEASAAKNQPLKSIFARYICLYLDT